MKIEQPGWYRRRDGGLAYVAAIVPEEVDESWPIVGFTDDEYTGWQAYGSYLACDTCCHDKDLMAFESQCTGWDWQPGPQYRVPTDSDALKRPMVEVRDIKSAEWRERTLLCVTERGMFVCCDAPRCYVHEWAEARIKIETRKD